MRGEEDSCVTNRNKEHGKKDKVKGVSPGVHLWTPWSLRGWREVRLKWSTKVKVAQSCLMLCDLMDYTVRGLL